MATINGTSRADKLTAAAADTFLDGKAGNDTLSSASFAGVSLYGNDGDDILIAKATDVLIDGGAGKDTVQFAAAVAVDVLSDDALVDVERIVITNTGNAVYDFSAQGVDVLETLNITGGKGNDTIYGGQDADTLSGGAGNDLLVAQDTDALIDGGAGIDTVSFDGAVSVADLTDKDLVGVEKVEITDSEAAVYDFSVQSEGLVIMGVDDADTIIGGKGADTVQFDAAVSGLTDLALKNVEKVEIVDLDGSGIRLDLWLQTESLQISGAGENDTILGGYRADTITGGAGADALYGNDGADLILADASDVLVDGGAGDDTVRYAAAVGRDDELAEPLLSDDELVNVERILITNTGNAVYDFSAQGAGDDTVAGGLETLNISGGAGRDTIYGGQDADTLSGGAGDDKLFAQDTDALIDGGAGIDTVSFAAAVSKLNLTDKDLVGVEKVEISNEEAATYDFSVQSEGLIITGGSAGDFIMGSGKGADSISGDAGDDSLVGGAGSDTLFGGVGDDTLIGGVGADILRGGDNADVLEAEDTDTLIDGGSNAATGVYLEYDTVKFAKSVSANNLRDVDMVGIEKVEITNTVAGRYDFSVQSEALNITGGSAADNIVGGKDWDTFVVNDDVTAVGDSYDGGAGTDTLLVTAHADMTGLTGLTRVEVIQLESEVDATFAAAALTGDTIAVNGVTGPAEETLTVTGTAASDTINLSGLTLTEIASVSINGGMGKDTITGTSLADTITGGAGADVMNGGGGVDQFVVNFASLSAATADSTASAMDVISAAASDSVSFVDTNNDTTTTIALATDDTSGDAVVGAFDILVDNGVVTDITKGDGFDANPLTIGTDADVNSLAEVLAILSGDVDHVDGTVLFFEYGSDGYLFVQNGAADVVVKLVGVTGIDTLTDTEGVFTWTTTV